MSRLLAAFIVISLFLRPSAEAEPIAEFPIEVTSGKPFVAVEVNGRGPYWFILDTGFPGDFTLSRTLALQLGIKIENEKRLRVGAGEGSVLRGQAKAVSFKITAKVGTKNRSVAVMELDHFASFDGRPCAGLIGGAFWHSYVTEIDYKTQRIKLHDPLLFKAPKDAQKVPVILDRGWLVARSSLRAPLCGLVKGRFVIDTGARVALILCAPFARKHSLSKRIPGLLAGTAGAGVGGESKAWWGRAASLRFGEVVMEGPMVHISKDRGGILASSAIDGVIGARIIARKRLFLDYQGRVIYLDAPIEAPMEDRSGLFLVAKGKRFNRFTVQSVLTPSPASHAGLQKGDVLRLLAKARASLDDLRARLSGRGMVTLEVERSGIRFKKSFALRDLYPSLH